MKTQILNIEKQTKVFTLTTKSDVALKIAIFATILACINFVAFI